MYDNYVLGALQQLPPGARARCSIVPVTLLLLTADTKHAPIAMAPASVSQGLTCLATIECQYIPQGIQSTRFRGGHVKEPHSCFKHGTCLIPHQHGSLTTMPIVLRRMRMAGCLQHLQARKVKYNPVRGVGTILAAEAKPPTRLPHNHCGTVFHYLAAAHPPPPVPAAGTCPPPAAARSPPAARPAAAVPARLAERNQVICCMEPSPAACCPTCREAMYKGH